MIARPFTPFKRFVKRIASPSNPLIKTMRRLAHPRRREARILLEGEKLVRAALESGLVIETLVLDRPPSPSELVEFEAAGADVTEVSATLFRRVSSVESPEGVLAVARRPARSLDDLPAEGFVLVSAGIQDPGNLGAIARVAEAGGARALAVVKGSANPFGPKAVRGSMGSLLRLPVFENRECGFSTEKGVSYRRPRPAGRRRFSSRRLVAAARDSSRRRGSGTLRRRRRRGRSARDHPHGGKRRIPERGDRRRARPLRGDPYRSRSNQPAAGG